MKEKLEKFVNDTYFPIVTGSLKGIPFIHYFYSHGPEDISLFGWYIAISALSDLVEGAYRSWFKPDSEIHLSFFEWHLVYDAPKLLFKAGVVAGYIISDIYTNTKDHLNTWWDSLRRR